MTTVLERTTLKGALACLDIDLEQELHQWQRVGGEPEFLLSLLGNKPTPPPELAWTFPPAAMADERLAPLEATEVITDSEPTTPLEVPDLDGTVVMAVAPLETEFRELTHTLALRDVGEDETTDEMAQLLADEPAALPLSQRASWSERLNRVFARRQALGGALMVAEETLSDPWVETFPEPHPQPQRGLQYPILGFAIGLTVATLGTLGVVFVKNQPRPTQTPAAQLTVPAPPPESGMPVSPGVAPVPNLARKELPDLSAIPTASPQPAASPSPGFFYVVSDYQNEQSLVAAQKVIPEAFVWQFSSGVKVQLAAFEVRDQAEQFVANLKAQGFNARVYP